MGYWATTADGASLQVEDTGLIWGDAPADALDDALVVICRAFVEDLGRMPSKGELRAGLEFAIGPWKDDGRHLHMGVSSVCACGKEDTDEVHN